MSFKPFSAQYRLHYSWEYRKFFNQSDVFKFGECIVFRIPNELGHFRLGITFKARGSSINRNKVKRQIRECFRTAGPTLGAYDFNVVVPKSKQLIHPFSHQLKETLKRNLPHVAKNSAT